MDTHRYKNLMFILNKLYRKHKIVIVEQITDFSHLSLPEIYNIKNINHVKLYSECKNIKKCWLINMSCNFVKTSFIWIIDCDFYMNFDTVKLSDDMLNKYNFIQPFVYARNLSELETKTLHDTGHIEIKYYDGLESEHRHVNVYGALSFIFNINKFKQIGGMDEQYQGWGYEDYDIFLRIHEQLPNENIYINKQQTGMHQWHPVMENIENQASNNLEIFQQKDFNLTKVNKILKAKYYQDWDFGDVD